MCKICGENHDTLDCSEFPTDLRFSVQRRIDEIAEVKAAIARHQERLRCLQGKRSIENEIRYDISTQRYFSYFPDIHEAFCLRCGGAHRTHDCIKRISFTSCPICGGSHMRSKCPFLIKVNFCPICGGDHVVFDCPELKNPIVKQDKF